MLVFLSKDCECQVVLGDVQTRLVFQYRQAYKIPAWRPLLGKNGSLVR